MRTLMLGLGLAGSTALTSRAIEPHPHIRAEAIRAVDAAIKQLRLAQQYDAK